MIKSRRDVPEYPIESVKRAILRECYFITRSAAQGAAILCLDEDDIRNCVRGMKTPDWCLNPMESCPICEEHLEEISQEREVRMGTRSTRVLDRFLRCPGCEEEFYSPGQMDATLTRAAEALRKEEGLLTPSQVQAIRLKLGLSQQAFEHLLGVGPKTVVRWEKGTVFQNHATDSLLRVVDRFPEVVRFLADLHGVRLPDSAKVASG